jgi:hypothetical protein
MKLESQCRAAVFAASTHARESAVAATLTMLLLLLLLLLVCPAGG